MAKKVDKRTFFLLVGTLCAAVLMDPALADRSPLFVRVSMQDPRYFELSDGTAYIPIGLNLIAPSSREGPQQGLTQMQQWMKKLSANRGNYIRLWLSHGFWDIEHTKSGQYDAEKAKRIDTLLALARRHDIRVKMTLEHFRNFDGKYWAGQPIHHVSQGGPAEDVTDFFTGQRSREQFKKKLAWYARRYGSDPTVFAWELWNEINCVRGRGWHDWTELMLGELHRRFPSNLATQSLGSFDNDGIRALYRQVCTMRGNNIAQVHRYLDLGASLAVCHGPVDVLAADAVRELRAFEPRKPILLAESGAVEPRHSGPFKLYNQDKAGIILHDVLFAPFFAGAAGPGQIWHWDRYVDQQDVWHHYDRFAEAVHGLDPPREKFEPIELEHPQLRVYALKGNRTILAWCRDRQNTWQTELKQGKIPKMICGVTLDLGRVTGSPRDAGVRVYDPWQDRWTSTEMKKSRIMLPDFARSLVVRIEAQEP